MWNPEPETSWVFLCDCVEEFLRRLRNNVRKASNRLKLRRVLIMGMPVRRDTKHLHWIQLRYGVASSDSIVPLGVTTSKEANIPSHAKNVALGMNIVELRFLADADGRSCTAYVYAARINDDPCLVCSIATTAGKQVASDGRYYADSLQVTNAWFEGKEIKTADAGGADRMGRVAFDFLGYDKLFILFDISSGTWGVDFTGF